MGVMKELMGLEGEGMMGREEVVVGRVMEVLGENMGKLGLEGDMRENEVRLW